MTLTVQHVADELRVHRCTVGEWIRRGDLDCVRLGDGKRARIRITREQLNEFLKNRSGHYRSFRHRRFA